MAVLTILSKDQVRHLIKCIEFDNETLSTSEEVILTEDDVEIGEVEVTGNVEVDIYEDMVNVIVSAWEQNKEKILE